MPRTAGALSEPRDDEAATRHVDDLVRRGRRQGYLMLPELRNAFEQASVTPAEARSILRELADEGIQLGNEGSESPAAATASQAGHGFSEVEPAEVTHAVPDLAEIDLGGPDLAVAVLDEPDLLDAEFDEAGSEASRGVRTGRARDRKSRGAAGAGVPAAVVADDDLSAEADLDDQTSVIGD